MSRSMKNIYLTKRFGNRVSFGFVLIFSLMLSLNPVAAQKKYRCDPSKVLTFEVCSKCHSQAVATWKKTPHSKTFEQLHRNPRAKAICEKLGLKGSIKRNDTCVECHYTAQIKGDRIRVVSGIGCESCHGAASDWINSHADYGGPTATKHSETVEHRNNRIAKSVETGMRIPRNLYSLAQSCLRCHTVPNEKLVNSGGHLAGSKFELVAWSQGSVRHNFIRSSDGSNTTNSQETLRVMFIVGQIADLELSTRATAKATEKNTFGVVSAKRAAKVAVMLYEIQQEIKNPDLQTALEAFAKAELRINNAEQLDEIANTIMNSGYAFAQNAKGSTLGAVDKLIPPPSQYK